jgi:signal transduction histidine kinase
MPAAATLEQTARQPPEAIYGAREGLPNNDVVRLFEDSRGDIWIATRAATPSNLSRWERRTGTIHVIRDGLSVEHQFPTAFVEDRQGALWIGFEGGGLARYANGRFAIFGSGDGVPPNVLGLHVDGSGRLWIASSRVGLSVVDDVAADAPRFSRYTTADGLSSNNIQCLTGDKWGRLYLGTARGVDRFDPSSGRVKQLTTADGLAADYVTAAFHDREGMLWFGTTDGVSRLVPMPDAPSVAPPVWIGEVRVAGAALPMSELGAPGLTDLRLEPAENNLQIAFFGVGFGAGGPLRYRYRLDGIESGWTGPTDRRIVNYARLASGTYRFVVEAMNADGVVSSRPAVVSFTVLPPIWRRWWFLSLAALAIAASLYTVYHYRVAHLLELERMRTRIAADLHDDIGGSLSRIALQSEVARRDVGEPTGAAARQLVDIGDTARTLVDALGDVVWSVDPVQDDLASVERRVREYAADVLGAHGVRWTFHGSEPEERIVLDPQARRDLLLLLKEGVTNIARHAEARVASLHLRVDAGVLHAELQDDGRGFDAGVPDDRRGATHRGLGNMRLRARQLGGRLDIQSTAGHGTRLVLRAPLKARKRMTVRLRRPARS